MPQSGGEVYGKGKAFRWFVRDAQLVEGGEKDKDKDKECSGK